MDKSSTVAQALAQRGEFLEEMSGDEILSLAYDLLDEIERLRALVDQLGEALADECGDGDFWHKLTDPALTAWEKERARRG